MKVFKDKAGKLALTFLRAEAKKELGDVTAAEVRAFAKELEAKAPGRLHHIATNKNLVSTLRGRSLVSPLSNRSSGRQG